jgi:hypothetical protein
MAVGVSSLIVEQLLDLYLNFIVDLYNNYVHIIDWRKKSCVLLPTIIE